MSEMPLDLADSPWIAGKCWPSAAGFLRNQASSDRERELARKNISRPQLIADCRRAERDRDHEPSAPHDSRSRRAHVRVPTTRENLLMLRCDVSRPSRRTGHSTQQQHAEHTGARSEPQPRVVSRAFAQAPRTVRWRSHPIIHYLPRVAGLARPLSTPRAAHLEREIGLLDSM